MNTRERFHAVMNFQPFDRLPIVEWASWWNETLDRWHSEKLPGHIRERYEICKHFGQDVYKQEWFRPPTAQTPKPASHGAGIIATEEDYDRLLPTLFAPGIDEARWSAWAEEQARGESVLWFTFDGPFWFPRTLLGIERHLFAFYDQPELMQRMNDDLADWCLRRIDEICAICTPDFMTFGEDMSYNHGPMLSKELFDAFLLPFYRKVVPTLHERGIMPIIDSDGDITRAAPWFEEAGLSGILPLERQAGVDMALLRKRHPRMRFIGCYDKMCMNKGEAAMRAEFERLLPIAARGGLIISCDHQTPPGVSYDEYQLYLRLFREYAEQAGAISREQLPGR